MALVDFEIHDAVAVVTLNRPQKRNVINAEVAVLLDEAFTEILESSVVRAAVLTGAGEQAFCGGADLGELIPLATGTRPPATDWDHRVLEIARRGPFLGRRDPVKPVIAAINGDAFGLGMEMLLGTDLRLAVAEARFGFQEAKWGLFPVGGSTVRLPAQIPLAVAMEMMLTGEMLSASRAAAVGLVNHIVPRQELLSKSMALARCIAANAPLAVQAIRKSLRECRNRPEADAFELESRIAAPVLDSQDAREGMRAFLERRPPRFRGE